MATFLSSPPTSALPFSASRPARVCNGALRPLSWKTSPPAAIFQTERLTTPSAERLGPLKAMQEGGVEPDLPEDDTEIFATAGEELPDFPYGKVDGAHTWHEGDDGTFWEGIQEVIRDGGGPTGGQGVISWLFLPAFFMGLAFNVQVEYLFLGTMLFIFAFIGIEMAKTDKENNVLPELYMQDKKN